MNPIIRSLTVLFLSLAILTSLVAAEITIEKKLNPEYNQGDKIEVQYQIVNSFNADITVTLTDKNEINGSGYAIECAQFNLPANNQGILDLNQNGIDTNFIASVAGKFDLGKSKLTFRDPQLGIIEEIYSNSPIITIKKGTSHQIKKEILPINLCNQEQKQQQQQQQEQKQNQPPKEEMQKQMQQQQQEMMQQQEEMQQQYNRQDDMQKKMEAAQQNMNQDANSVKQAMEMQKKRQDAMNQQLEQKVENSTEFQKMEKSLKEQGFEQEKKSLEAKSNDTGDFNYQYKNRDTQETAQIQGEMMEGKMDSIKNTNDIKQDKDYQELKINLEKNGFQEQGEPKVESDKFSTDFTNPKTGETAKISGDLEKKPENMVSEFENKEMLQKILNNPAQNNQKLRDFIKNDLNSSISTSTFNMTQIPGQEPQIDNQTFLKRPIPFNSTTGELLEEPKFKEKINYWWVSGLVLLGLIALLLVKYSKKDKILQKEEERPIDYYKESLKIIEESQKLFDDKMYKDAYGKAGYALRFFFSHKYDVKSELTTNEVIKLMKNNKGNFKDANECLSLCNLVEFAKYEPNTEDFSKIIDIAVKLIKENR